jgi:hypothetical protein
MCPAHGAAKKGDAQPAKTKPYEYWIEPVMNGVKKEIRKFQSQLDAVASDDCFARVRGANDSPMMIHTPGAHVVAKPKMNRHADATMTAASGGQRAFKGGRLALTRAGGLVVRDVPSDAYACEDKEPEGHPEPAEDERPTPTELLHDVQTAERRYEVDRAEDDLSDERVGDADRLEDRRAVVEEVAKK